MAEVRKLSASEVSQYTDWRSRRPKQTVGNLAVLDQPPVEQTLSVPPSQEEQVVSGAQIIPLYPQALVTENTFGDFNVTQEKPLVLRNKKGQIQWRLSGNTPQQNEQLGIENVQALFLERFPEFNELFPRGDNGEINGDKKAEAIKFISKTIGNSRKFIEIFGDTLRNKENVPYFEGSYSVVIEKAFKVWGLAFENKRTGKKERVFVDENGEDWICVSTYAKEIGVSKGTVQKYVIDQNISYIHVRGANGVNIKFYNKKEVENIIGTLISSPLVDKKSGLYRDASDCEWSTISFLKKGTDLAYGTISKLLQNVPSISGRGKSGGSSTLYNLSEARKVIADFLSLPQVDKLTNIYIDENREGWVVIAILAKRFGLDYETISRRFKNIPSVIGRDNYNRQTILVNEKEAIKEIEFFLSLPQVDKKSGIYIDNDGQNWVVPGYFCIKYDIHYHTLSKYLENARICKGRDKLGQESLLYNEQEVMETLSSFISLPQINTRTEIYVDGEGKEWVSVPYIQKQYGLSRTTVRNRLLNVQTIKCRDKRGSARDLFLKSEAITLMENHEHRIKPKRDNSRVKADELSVASLEQLFIEKRKEILDQFGLFLDQNLDTTMSILDFATEYLRKGGQQ